MIKSNREWLIPAVKTIILCGQENIPLRGHRDDGTLSDEISQGKFLPLLKFCIDSGDLSFQKYLETVPKNATYLSKTTQNQLIDCCHSIIMKKVLDKVKEAKHYAVLGDETMDASGTEQLSVCIRYLNLQKSTIPKDFICFLSATDKLVLY
ncbi:52 kDa repressor of the inhibitor of the protein kinase-like [Schistocerca piceifrons]|uniref:52 kDa repressor of the inhibitor of the protein kinase-like n=1 Tax=Schistocerca piceifrons TaxID=274613 RepID=UPI001F5FD88D|nr:52 kDa repressor of the inhibitor of the protein kinase-like [Schistocerca piceifrons]